MQFFAHLSFIFIARKMILISSHFNLIAETTTKTTTTSIVSSNANKTNGSGELILFFFEDFQILNPTDSYFVEQT